MTNNIMVVEKWQQYSIRFVWYHDEWCAIASDIAKAMGFRDAESALRHIPSQYKDTALIDVLGGTPKGCTTSKTRDTQSMLVLTEQGLYRLIMRSNKKEAEVFQDWVYTVLKRIREDAGLEGFQAFRLMDKDVQKSEMVRLDKGLNKASQRDYIKANTITDKAISNKYGFDKMVKKPDMTPQMLKDRQPVLGATVNLMLAYRALGITRSVSKDLYGFLQEKGDK